MSAKLTDAECFALAQQIAVGRSQKEMLPILHAGHESVTLATEADKHADLIKNRGQALSKGARILSHGQAEFNKETWDDLESHLLDRQGSNHIDVALGLAFKALFERDQCKLEAYLYLLFKAADLTFPHVRTAVEIDLASKGKP